MAKAKAKAKAKTTNPLSGLSAEGKKKVRELIKKEKAAEMLDADKDFIASYDGLVVLRGEIDKIIAGYKNAERVLKSTTLAKLLKMPKVKPKNVGNFVRKNFGRSGVAPEKNKKVPATKIPAMKKSVAKKK